MTAPPAPAAASSSSKGHPRSGLAAWAATHKTEAYGGGAAALVALYALYRSHQSSSSTSTTAAAPTATYDPGSLADQSALDNALAGLNSQLANMSAPSSPGTTPPPSSSSGPPSWRSILQGIANPGQANQLQHLGYNIYTADGGEYWDPTQHADPGHSMSYSAVSGGPEANLLIAEKYDVAQVGNGLFYAPSTKGKA